MKERAYPVYQVNKHAEGLLVGGHPWVYENDITDQRRRRSRKTAPWPMWSAPRALTSARALSRQHSKIRVRLISRNANDTFDAAFWRRRVEYAWAYRKTVLEPDELSALPGHLRRGRPVPRPDGGPFRPVSSSPRP